VAQIGRCWSNDLRIQPSESLALRLLNVSFLGVSFLLSVGLVGVVWTRGLTGSGEKQVNGDVRGGGKLSGQIRTGVSAWQISESGRAGRSRETLAVGLSGTVVLLPKCGLVL
jgi:hypothetical protein